MKKFFFIGLIFLFGAIFVAGCAQSTPPTPGNNGLPPAPDNQGNTQDNGSNSQNTVEIISSGFSPSTITINAGETIVFINKDSAKHRIASDPHPTHEGYPESGGCSGSTFDSCRGLAQGESFSFAFSQKGTWGFHDHLNPSLAGTVIVQ